MSVEARAAAGRPLAIQWACFIPHGSSPRLEVCPVLAGFDSRTGVPLSRANPLACSHTSYTYRKTAVAGARFVYPDDAPRLPLAVQAACPVACAPIDDLSSKIPICLTPRSQMNDYDVQYSPDDLVAST